MAMAIDEAELDRAGAGEPAVADPGESDGSTPAGAAADYDVEELRSAVASGRVADDVEDVLDGAAEVASRLEAAAAEHTVRVNPELDEDAFFTAEGGGTTVVNRYDLEKSVPLEKKHH